MTHGFAIDGPREGHAGVGPDGAIGRGFDDPVLGAQKCFRTILAAMSEPGTLHHLAQSIEVPHGLHPAAGEILLTLADYETPVWLAPKVAGAGAYVRFHCGAATVAAPGDARLAVLDRADAQPGLAAFDAGDDRYPDRSATLIVQCGALAGGLEVQLSGPGIREPRVIAPTGLADDFWSQVDENSQRYPLGVDLVLVAGTDMLCLPRSTRIAMIGERR